MGTLLVILVVIAVLLLALSRAHRRAPDPRVFCPRAETLVSIDEDACRAEDGSAVGNMWACERECLYGQEAAIRRTTGVPVALR